MSKIIEISGVEAFDQAIANDVSVVDFWAPWCGPCRMMMPVVEEIAEEIPTIKFFKVNVDDDNNRQVANKFNIMSIPAFVAFRNGSVIGTQIGGKSKQEMKNWLQNIKAIKS
ncbi:MAG: Thioredoxin [Pseudomonadota bacterium]|jgi:thioredoxin 1